MAMGKTDNALHQDKMIGMMGVFFMLCLIGFSAPAYATDTDDTTEIPECKEIQEGITQNTQSYVMYQLQAEQEAFKSRMKQFELNPMQVHPSVGDTQCIRTLLKKQEYLASSVSLKSKLKAWVASFLLDLANQACTYVSTNIETALNNALNLICIPVPDLAFAVELPSLDKTTCDGVSLQNYMKFKSMPASSFSSRVPETYLSAPMIRNVIDVQTTTSSTSSSSSSVW